MAEREAMWRLCVWWNGMLGGQYTNLSDAYISVIKSLQHACLAAKYKLEILWIEAAMLEDKSANEAPEKVRLLGVPFFQRVSGVLGHVFIFFMVFARGALCLDRRRCSCNVHPRGLSPSAVCMMRAAALRPSPSGPDS